MVLERLSDDFDIETKRSFKAFWICFGKDIIEGKLINFETNWDLKYYAKKWFCRNKMYEKNLMMLEMLKKQEIMYEKMKEKEEKKKALQLIKWKGKEEAVIKWGYLVGDLEILAIELGFPISFDNNDDVEKTIMENLQN